MNSAFLVLFLALATEARYSAYSAYSEPETKSYGYGNDYQKPKSYGYGNDYQKPKSYEPEYPKHGYGNDYPKQSYEPEYPKHGYGNDYQKPKSYEPEYPKHGYENGYRQPETYRKPSHYGGYPEPKSDYVRPNPYRRRPNKSNKEYLSNAVGTVISIRHTAFHCTYRHQSTYAALSDAFDKQPMQTMVDDQGNKGMLTSLTPLILSNILSGRRENPLIEIKIENKAKTDSTALNENDVRNGNDLSNEQNIDASNKQQESQRLSGKQASGQFQAGLVSSRPRRGLVDSSTAYYDKYSHCTKEIDLGLVQLSGEHSYLKDYALDGYKIVGGYSYSPDSGTRMFKSVVKAPVSTYGDNYGALGYAKDKYSSQYQRRSSYMPPTYSGPNAILTVWGWALFCKPRAYAKPEYSSYQSPGYGPGYGSRYGYNKRSMSGYSRDPYPRDPYHGLDCWKEGIDLTMELEKSKHYYCYSHISYTAINNANIVVGAAKKEKAYAEEPAYPSYPEPSPSYASRYGPQY